MKLALPDVTLVCVDCIDPYRAICVIEHCRKMCDFGDVQFLTSEKPDYPHVVIDKITGVDQVQGLVNYSIFMLYQLHKYIRTPYLLTVQHDGWIMNPTSWDAEWFNYDYIGPLFIQVADVGSGGFSFRSKKLMELTAKILPPQIGSGINGMFYEDGIIAYALRKKLESYGCRFPSPETAARFAYGGNAAHYCATPFGYHGFYALDKLLGGTGENIPRMP